MSDIYVSTADLSDSRPPPDKRVGIMEILLHPLLLNLLALSYLATTWINRDNIVKILVDAGILPLDKIFGNVPLINSLVDSFSENFQEGFGYALLACIPFLIIVFGIGISEQMRKGVLVFTNITFIRDFIQVAMLVVILALAYGLIQNLTENFEGGEANLIINFNVLEREYGVDITEGPDYEAPLEWNILGLTTLKGEDVPIIGGYLAPKTYVRALLTGLSNTLRAVFWSLIFATLLGVFLGIGLLTDNWLVRNVSMIYVEIFRNTPLLVQIFFVFSSINLLLPAIREPIELPLSIYAHQRGINYPRVYGQDSFWLLAVFAGVGFIIGVFLWRWRLKIQDETGVPAFTMRYFLASFLGLGLVGLIFATVLGLGLHGNLDAGFPLGAEPPVASRFGFEQGIGDNLSAQFLGIFLALVLYTAAFIADIVRAGIQSVPHGQIEAARAHGLNNSQTMRLIVLPQAMRLIIPPMTNQYLNLAKNSSLAIGIGYYDLYNVSNIASNQSGQVVVFFVVMMVTYLAISLSISVVMNAINRSMRLRSR